MDQDRQGGTRAYRDLDTLLILGLFSRIKNGEDSKLKVLYDGKLIIRTYSNPWMFRGTKNRFISKNSINENFNNGEKRRKPNKVSKSFKTYGMWCWLIMEH